MGNTVLKDYNVNKTIKSSGGLNHYWKIYDADHKETKQHVAVHLLVKKELPKKLRNEAFYEVIRKEAQVLARIRHPLILKLVHPLSESQQAFCMVTEPLLGSVSNLFLQDHSNLSPIPTAVRDFVSNDLSINNGMRHLTEAVCFLHQEASMYHRGLSPSCVYVDPEGTWKLGGFYYSKKVTSLGMYVYLLGDTLYNNINTRLISEPDRNMIVKNRRKCLT